MYALYDKKVKAYLNPVEFKNHADAVRWLETIVNTEKDETNISKYPNDFILVHVANFDDQNAKFENINEDLMQADQVVRDDRQYDLLKAIDELKVIIKETDR